MCTLSAKSLTTDWFQEIVISEGQICPDSVQIGVTVIILRMYCMPDVCQVVLLNTVRAA
jgi:hypothetical protein